MVQRARSLPVGQRVLALVGFLAVLELTSGVLQGYYTPLYPDIARHLDIRNADVNWFEAAQLLVSAVVVPTLARWADLVGPKRVLLISTIVTACGAWATVLAPSFWTFLLAWALMGSYVVWLPLEIAIVNRRANAEARRLRSAAALLVFALEIGVIVGALSSGALAANFGTQALLVVPAVAVTASAFVVWRAIPDVDPLSPDRKFDLPGATLLSVALIVCMSGLMVMRLRGVSSGWAWLLIGLGILGALTFGLYERRQTAPLINLSLLLSSRQWPIQLASALFGMSVLGAQIPLSTFARSDPATAGYGLGVDASGVSALIGAYVLALAVGAMLLPLVARRLRMRGSLAAGALLVGVGYGLFLVNHGSLAACIINMALAGVGSGVMLAALPAAAAEYAPPSNTAEVAGLTNMSKTMGGAIASCIFALCLSAGGSLGDPRAGQSSLAGYQAVWAVCAGSAILAAIILAAFLKTPSKQA